MGRLKGAHAYIMHIPVGKWTVSQIHTLRKIKEAAACFILAYQSRETVNSLRPQTGIWQTTKLSLSDLKQFRLTIFYRGGPARLSYPLYTLQKQRRQQTAKPELCARSCRNFKPHP